MYITYEPHLFRNTPNRKAGYDDHDENPVCIRGIRDRGLRFR